MVSCPSRIHDSAVCAIRRAIICYLQVKLAWMRMEPGALGPESECLGVDPGGDPHGGEGVVPQDASERGPTDLVPPKPLGRMEDRAVAMQKSDLELEVLGR